MTHLIVSREYPPCAYPQGGIGTYVAHMARLLAEHGETVHVIGERWKGAPHDREALCDGRLIVHRVPLDRPMAHAADRDLERRTLDAMRRSDCPEQAFSWQVARLAERLVDEAQIDCIEAQEYEAPLYYFLLRRALGAGPSRQPPCFVHLHSPTQFVFHHNDWDISRLGHLTRKRLEDYVIQASDAALSPSRYLARQVEQHYGLDDGSVARIPYPKGDTPELERTPDTWETGAICYFGRMESRKGVFEWVDAAVAVARERPDARFELVGSDTPLTGEGRQGVRAALTARIPVDLRSSFVFLDALSRSELFARLARARIAVVPSRWENFPNTCVEAMSTGLPVLASPEGGMAEMIEDGRTGWLARSVRPADLAETLRRALDTPAHGKADMGRAASQSIRRLCDNDRTIAEQIAFRRALVARGPGRSTRIPGGSSSLVVQFPPASAGGAAHRAGSLPNREPVATTSRGVAVVLVAASTDDVEECVAGLRSQRVGPVTVAFETDITARARERLERHCREAGIDVLSVGSGVALGDAAVRQVIHSADSVLGVAVVPTDCRIEPAFLERIEATLLRHPSVGVVSTWGTVGASLMMRPSPSRPFQWMQNDISRCCAFRADALRAVDWLWDIPGARLDGGAVGLAVLLQGWGGVCYPEALSWSRNRERAGGGLARVMRTRVVAQLRAYCAGEVARDGAELLELAQASLELSAGRLTAKQAVRMLPRLLGLRR